jgi:hypothetical protein
VAPHDDVVSPELVLVSPPEIADRARGALPDYEREYGFLLLRIRAAFAEAAVEEQRRERRFMIGAFTFTAVMALNAIAPVLVFLVFR